MYYSRMLEFLQPVTDKMMFSMLFYTPCAYENTYQLTNYMILVYICKVPKVRDVYIYIYIAVVNSKTPRKLYFLSLD